MIFPPLRGLPTRRALSRPPPSIFPETTLQFFSFKHGRKFRELCIRNVPSQVITCQSAGPSSAAENLAQAAKTRKHSSTEYIERLNALNFCLLAFYFLVFWCHSCRNICKLTKEKE